MPVMLGNSHDRPYDKPIRREEDGDILFASLPGELTALEEAQAELAAANIKIAELLAEVKRLQDVIMDAMGL